MNRRKTFLLIIIISVILIAAAGLYKNKKALGNTVSPQIYLYGEKHGVESIIKKEFDLWYNHYHQDGMRHLFIETSYFMAEFLNIWMSQETDDILDAVFIDLEGTAMQNPLYKDFYKKIKEQCPETVFHGTDVGHQFFSMGKRFLEYLEQNGLKDTKQYLLTLEAIEQGEYFYDNSDDVYRENKMTENFIREFDSLIDEKIMGIYGSSHTGLYKLDFTNQVASMANQLRQHYGDIIYSKKLSK